MLNTEHYKEDIFKYHEEGFTRKEIQVKLNFKNWQPIYNFYKKYNLTPNDRSYDRKYTLDENYFKIINTADKAYILGFICADGHVAKDKISICLSIKDIEILHKIKFYLKSNQELRYYLADNPYTKTDNKVLSMVNLSLNSKKLVKPLIDMGIGGNKTYTLNKSILHYIPKYLIRDFLRGYFDGDGNVSFGKKYSSGTKYNINICGNEDFLLNTYQIYFPSNCKLYKDKYSKQCYIWKLSSKESVIAFLDYLYYNSSIFLQRKYKEYLKSRHMPI